MASVALVTCAHLPDLDDDDRPIVDALAARGITAVPAVWDDTEIDWDRFDLAVLRSPWDYVDRREAFVAWASAVPRLANPADVVAWNVDKRYLADVAAAGVPVVPTTFVPPGAPVDVDALPDGDVVVKPTVSAGARDTKRLSAHDDVAAHAAAIAKTGRTAMVQPYLHAVDELGETAVVFLGGEHSHAACKGALLPPDAPPVTGLYARETMTPRTASDAELEVARAALSVVPAGTLYARVDLIPDASGQPVVLEIEVTEPSLFLAIGDAVDRCADAIARWIRTVPR